VHQKGVGMISLYEAASLASHELILELRVSPSNVGRRGIKV